MNKKDFIDKVKECGDATITYRSQESKKVKYNVCTLDFSNPHIQTKQNRAREDDDTVLLFCWDVDAYRLLKPANVTKVERLSDLLEEGKRGR